MTEPVPNPHAADGIAYGHVFASYTEGTADTSLDLDPYPDERWLSGSVTFRPKFAGQQATATLRVPGTPRARGLVVTELTYDVVNSRLVDRQDREGVWLTIQVGDIPVHWQATVALKNAAGKVVLTTAYVLTPEAWNVELDGTRVVNLPDLIPNPSLITPSELAAILSAQSAMDRSLAAAAELEAARPDIAAAADRAAAAQEAAQTAVEQVPLAKAEADRAIGLATAQDEHVAGVLEDPQSATHAAFKAVGNATYVPEAIVPINAARYVVADGTTDDTEMLNAAAAAARLGQTLNLGSKGVTLPADKTLYINGTVDLRYVINVDIDARIRVGPNGLIIAGHNSLQRPGQRLSFRDIRYAGAGQTNVCLRLIGMKQAQVHIGRCDHLELLADDSSTDSASLAYNNFFLGRIDKMHLKGVGPMGWITQNTFIGGTIVDLLLSGPYGHNENTWVKPCLEGGSVEIQRGARNRFLEARCESGTKITFGADTFRNVLEDSYVSNSLGRVPGAVVLSDLGVENVVTTGPDLLARPFEVAQVDNLTQAFDGACEYIGQGVRPGLDRVQPRGPLQFVLDTGIFPIGTGRATSGDAYPTAWSLRRFHLASDEAWFRPYVTLYDAAGNVVTAGGLVTDASWTLLTIDGVETYTASADRRYANILISSQTATHARIRARTGTVKPFRWLRLTAFTTAPSMPTGVETVRRQMRQPLYQPAKPTQGNAPLGTVVQGPSTSWKVTARVDTSLSSAAPPGMSITVASAAGIAAGDIIGVLLADGTTHWTAVSAISGATLTLSTGIPSEASVGARVATVRWT